MFFIQRYFHFLFIVGLLQVYCELHFSVYASPGKQKTVSINALIGVPVPENVSGKSISLSSSSSFSSTEQPAPKRMKKFDLNKTPSPETEEIQRSPSPPKTSKGSKMENESPSVKSVRVYKQKVIIW